MVTSTYKLNTDASVVGEQKRASIGVVVSDSNGQWIMGFAAKVGSSDVDSAKLQALKKGLAMAWGRHLQKVIVEMNSANVSKWVTTNVDPTLPHYFSVQDYIWFSRRPCRGTVNSD